ncbi:hypothetical protein OPT61_g4135 [Boeremia exigua]|uniref:Uncharacterized protein n=1 Tax=Boeremia exigua TaxID=749465 RepID=A0ACC2IFC2_9PLEO|nr:hypothetical protein OPT61_g4135 [Boeremia exigua]
MAAHEPKKIQKEVAEEPEVAVGTDELYSIYTNKEKWLIVAMVALAGFYSPLPANIYFPAIPTIARAFQKASRRCSGAQSAIGMADVWSSLDVLASLSQQASDLLSVQQISSGFFCSCDAFNLEEAPARLLSGLV